MKIVRDSFRSGHRYWFYCLGCKYAHSYLVGCGVLKQNWTYDPITVSFHPSLRLYYMHPVTQQEVTTCHLFVRNGQIEFCGDCPHDLKNQIVPLTDFPANYDLPTPYEVVL